MAALASAANLRRLQDFLRVSRDARLIETDVNVAMREAAELTRYVWRDEAEAQGILIDVVKDLADVPLVMAYSSLLREMVVELIFNAIEAMPQGGLITLRTERKDDQVLMAVTDTGEGMPDAVQLRVFDAFFTTKGPTHPGLGLNNVQNIAKRHNATITLTSSPGRGSTFTISLPMAPSVVPEAPALPRAEQPARILLIDDESVIRDITAKILTLRGHQLNVYDNGAEGVRAFSQPGAFDIVITDLGMPGMSGWEVARAIKEIDPKVLVVLMTGWAAELDPQKVREGGVDRVLNKPFDVDQVLALVNEAVTLRDRM
jgi:CheY-like chemotaxis protein/anti-sigma regulatory factor (Ser/Thr protein kinase)